MLNLSTLTYRNIYESDNGPISELSIKEISTIAGEKYFEAYAHLNSNLLCEASSNRIYGNSTGTGSSKTKQVACYKAISEALERWAFFASTNDSTKSIYGFDVDPSSNGMAAFSSFLKLDARKSSEAEAIERWALAAWWEGELAHRSIDLSLNTDKEIRCIEILSGFSKFKSVVVFYHDSQTKLSCFGFAASENFNKAVRKALVELDRNYRVLSSEKNINSQLSTQEQRLSYFATSEGYSLFSDRVNHVVKAKNNWPEPILSREIKGEWSKYATVWRTVFRPVSDRQFGDEIDYFMF